MYTKVKKTFYLEISKKCSLANTWSTDAENLHMIEIDQQFEDGPISDNERPSDGLLVTVESPSGDDRRWEFTSSGLCAWDNLSSDIVLPAWLLLVSSSSMNTESFVLFNRGWFRDEHCPGTDLDGHEPVVPLSDKDLQMKQNIFLARYIFLLMIIKY